MTALELVDRVRAAGGDVRATEGGELQIKGRRRLSPALAAELDARAPEVVAALQGRPAVATPDGVPVADEAPAANPGPDEGHQVAADEPNIEPRTAFREAHARLALLFGPDGPDPAKLRALWPQAARYLARCESQAGDAAARVARGEQEARGVFWAALRRWESSWRELVRRWQRCCHGCGIEATAVMVDDDGTRRCRRCLTGERANYQDDEREERT